MRRDGLTKTAPRQPAGRWALGALAATLLGLAPAAAAAPPPLPATTTTSFASTGAPVGGSITDNAVVSGGSATNKPTGTLTFALYGPTDTKCAGPAVFTSPAVALAPLTTSPAYTPTKAGTYTWIASYSGDTNNAPSSGACTDPGETVSVALATPTLTTTASPSVTLGGAIGDTAVLSGGYKPNGTITFRLYAPSDPSCAGAPVTMSTIGVSTPTRSAAFTPTVAGTYRWIATYNGDAGNAAASNACGDPAEAVAVTGPAAAPGGPAPAPAPAPGCDAAAMSRALAASLVAALTGTPASPFKATCSAGVRIVLRAREIRPGNPGYPRHDGFTTMANSLTHTTAAGAVPFSFNAQGLALRDYVRSSNGSLLVFAVVHVRPDRTQVSSESLQIFTLR